MKELKNYGITGVGKYVPERIMTNTEMETIVETSDEWIKKMTGIEERRIAAKGEATSDLAYNAALAALDSAKVDPKDIDLIVVATMTADHLTPSVSALLQKKLGAVKAAAFDLNAACSGFVYGIEAGGNFIATGLYKKVLVIGAEVFSSILDWEDRNTCILFGDGAGAVVLEEVEDGYGIQSSYLRADGDLDQALVVPGGGSRLPASHETIDGRQHYLKMKGQDVFKFAVSVLPEAVKKVVEDSDLEISDLDLIIPHQANKRIIQSAAKRLKISTEKFYMNLNKYGNTSAASIAIALEEAVVEGRVKKGDQIALVGFGAGLTYASLTMKWAY